MKNQIFYFSFLIITTIAFIALEYNRPKVLDWTQTFSSKDKIPYGTRALLEMLGVVAGGKDPIVVRKPMYNLFTEDSLALGGSFVCINNAFEPDTNDLQQLYEFVAKGNVAFIASNQFSEPLLDTLHLKVEQNDLIDYFKKDSLSKLKNVNLKALTNNIGDTIKVRLLVAQNQQLYNIPHQTYELHFVANDTTRASVLGVNKKGQYNFLKVPFGKGVFLLHSVPESFSNYFLVANSNADYSFEALSYLPPTTIYWDEYSKQGRANEGSVLRFFLNNEALSWAVYLSIFGILLYMIFQGKRTQRIIPIIDPPQNTSLAFVQTIGSLYYQQQDHSNIAQKKIQHFWAFIRNRFNIQTKVINDEFVEILAQKCGLEKTDIDAMLKVIERTQKFGLVSEYQLIELNNRIDEFYQKL